MTGNKAPGLVPKRFVYMTTDLYRLKDYFDVPMQKPSDPAEVMFNKGKVEQN